MMNTNPWKVYPDAKPAVVLGLLTRARGRIEDPQRFATKSFARNRMGEGTGWRDSDATSWCSYGSLMVETYEDGIQGNAEVASHLLRKASAEVWNSATLESKSGCQADREVAITQVNDVLGHPAVMRMYARAIVMALKAKE